MVEFDPEFIDQAKTEAERYEQRLLRWFGRIRKRFGKGKISAIDTLMKRSTGHTARIERGVDQITVKRFFFILALLRAPWSGLAAVLKSEKPIPDPPPPAYLSLFRNRPKHRSSTVAYLNDLIEWTESVGFSIDGVTFEIDPDFVRGLMNDNLQVALELAETTIRGVLASPTKTIEKETARRVAHLIGATAEMYRHRGQFNLSIDLFNIAFDLERRLGDLPARSYLFRASAYLLSDLGEVEEALEFAEKASRIAIATYRTEGLGQSLYVRAVMIDRLGDYESAALLYGAALEHLQDCRVEFRAAVHLAIAYAELQAGNFKNSKMEVEEAWTLASQPRGLLRARLLSVKAELMSLEGDEESAEGMFADAQSVFEEYGNSLDVALGALAYARHFLRFGRNREALGLVADTGRRANQLRGNRVGEAALLELIRNALRGPLTVEMVEEVLQKLERPWNYRAGKASRQS